MTETEYVTDHNPAAFFAALADRIKAGFYADDSVEGFPHFDILNEVKLTRSAKPSQRHDHTNVNEIHITSWHNTNLVLDYQDAVLQGFVLDPESLRLGEMHEPHTLVMKRAGSEAPQAPVSVPEAEPVAEPTPEPEQAVEAVVEAPVQEQAAAPEPVHKLPVAKGKGGRPPKPKPQVAE